ncbi:hypothetical protein ACN47E_005960 [Coniothyrium glycines]
MTTPAIPGPSSENVDDTAKAEVTRWPLAYCLQRPQPSSSSLQAYGFGLDKRPLRRWWSYKLYRGPNNKEVEILYSRTKAQSEIIAQHFVDEPILGFDMEWPWNDWKRDDLQNKVGLIQIASEAKIALFHIGLHPGKTAEDIIAPTLRKIIENPAIGKVGVAILKADFGRLKRFFGLKPQGAIELSHLYRLVKFGQHKPELVSVKLVSLATQVENQLGLPLFKGEVRTSDWSKPLSNDQINYAASDAYAGFMLYHRTNAKRLAMNPVPPLPVYAEKYPDGPATKDDPILLEIGDGTIISSATFFGTKPAKSEASKGDDKTQKIAAAAKKDKARVPVLDQVSQALFDDLIARRAIVAERTHMQAYRVISETLLAAIANRRPRDYECLLSIKGIGKFQAEKYGSAWLEVIALFHAKNGMNESPTTQILPKPDGNNLQVVHGAPRTPRRAQKHQQTSPASSPAFAPPPPRTPQLHTGLSFNLAETTIDDAKVNDGYASDDSLHSVDFGSPGQRRSSGQKRKRIESPIKTPNPARRLHSPAQKASGSSIDLSQYIHSPHRTGDATKATPVSASKPRNPKIVNEVFNPAAAAMTVDPPSRSKSLLQPLATNAPTVPRPDITATAAPPLSPHSRIARNKILAFSRLVARKLPTRALDAPPLVTEHTIDLIIRSVPSNQDELERIPGVDGLLLACEITGTDCLRNISKFTARTETR